MDSWLAERLAVYERLGYPVLLTSVASGEGVEALRAMLAGKISAFVGKSGVGKSSLLNALMPGLGQRVSEVSAITGKGRHTTTSTRLVPLNGPEGGYIADTAGIRALGLDLDATTDLAYAFREFRPYLGHCAHRGCQHHREPDCAIRAAVATGEVDRERYASYLRLREGE
jgi:ribosome biogenesis GTPase